MAKLQGSVLITGANGGLGSGFVANLLKSPQATKYRGIYTVRNPSTANDLKSVLAKGPQTHEYEILPIDLSSLESIRGFAENINEKVANGTIEPIRALILNAAWQEANADTLKPQTFTKDGFEGNFGTNYLANFLLVLLLLQSMDQENGRIVVLGSWTHDPFDKRNGPLAMFEEEEYKEVFKGTGGLAKGIEYTDDGYKAGMRRYGASKLLINMFMYELQRRLTVDPHLSKISVISMDPGGMSGGVGKNSVQSSAILRFIIHYLLPILTPILVWLQPNGSIRSPLKSGADLLRASFDTVTWGEHPKALYLDGTEKAQSSEEARDEGKQRNLWGDSLKLARVRSGETVLKNWE